jgi:predicted exporter
VTSRRRGAWTVALWCAFVLACAVVLVRTQFTTDFSAFLPRSPSPVQQVLVDQLRDGVVSRLILVGLEGAEPPVLGTVSRRMAAALGGADGPFAAVRNGQNVLSEKDRAYFWQNRYLLSSAVTPDNFSVAVLRERLDEALGLLGSPAGLLVQRVLPNDPTGELLRLLETLDAQAKPATREGVWFSPDGARALLLAQTRAPGYDIDAQEQAVGAIRAAHAKAVAEVGAKIDLLMTGPGVFSVSTRDRIKSDALRFALLAVVLVGGMLLALYRSWRVLGLGLLPVATGAVTGVTAVSLGFGSVHGLTLGFGTTLIGECVDYAIYLFTRSSPGTPPERTLDRIWPTLRLGVLTSICGFSAMLLSGFPGLAQLGLFSIAGLIAAAAVTRWMLPVLTPAGFGTPAGAALAPHVERVVERAPAARHAAWLLVGACAVFIAVQERLWRDDVGALSVVSSGEQKLDEQLRRDIGAPDVRHLVVIQADDAQGALEAAEDLAPSLEDAIARGWMGGFDSPATFLPSLRTQRARQAALPPDGVLRKRLSEASRELPFRPGLFEPFLRDVAAARTQTPVAAADLEGTAAALKVHSLLVQRPSGAVAMLPLTGVRDAGSIEREVASAAGGRALVVDLKREADALYAGYRTEAFRHAIAGLGAIVVLLALALRSGRRVFMVLLPLAAAVVAVTATILMRGAQLSIFHLVGLLLVVAVGSNYSLFFERGSEVPEDRGRTLVSLLFANLSTVLGFGLLSFSSVSILSDIGSTVALGTILTLVLSAVFVSRRAASSHRSMNA